MKDFKNDNKRNSYALVTGSADRIGRSIALELAHMGFDLLLHYRSSHEKVIALQEEITALGRNVRLVQFNFLADNDFDRLLASWKEEGVLLETLVNNASEFTPSGFEDVGGVMLTRHMQSNFEGAYLLTKSFARVFEKGLVLNLLDTKVTKDYTKHLDYLLSKKLFAEFTKLAAVHLAPDIRVNGICPGLILPPKDKDEQYLENLATAIPLKRTGSLADIQKAVHFLVESTFVTGQILYIDGGEHLSF